MIYKRLLSRSLRTGIAATLATLAVGCATSPPEPDLPPRKETILAVTDSHHLIRFNAGQPRTLLDKKPLTGLQPGEVILGIDFRLNKGVLYALGNLRGQGRLYTVDTATGRATPVGEPLAVALEGVEFGFDFNPTVDRIRVVSNTGQNLRLHPDTGAVVDADPSQPGVQLDARLAFDVTDRHAGQVATVMAAAYTYNKSNDKITTNFAIDGRLDMLLVQGSREGVVPAVSPNTGKLFTVGKLGAGSAERVSFDIADSTGAGFAAFTQRRGGSRFYLINLETGTATFLGTIGGGELVRGITFEP